MRNISTQISRVRARCANETANEDLHRNDVLRSIFAYAFPLKTILAVSCLLPAVHHARAVPSFDPVADATADGGTSYTIGTNLVGQYNSSLYGPWYVRGTNFGTTQPMIAAGNLAYPGLPASTGNSISFVPANAASACIDLNLAAMQTEPVYYSFLLKITDLSAVPNYPTNNPFAAFGDEPSLSFSANQIGRLGCRMLTQKSGAGYVLGLGRGNTISDYVYDTTVHNVGDVVFVVASYQWDGATTNLHMWINPDMNTFGDDIAPSPTISAPNFTATGGALNGNGARAFGILCQFPSAPSGVIDDVRVATTWKYVTGNYLTILQDPTSQTLPPGYDASFNVVAKGALPLTYQWIKDGVTVLTDGGNISGAHSNTLTINNISGGDIGSYAVYVTNLFGDFALSGSASLNFSDPAFTGQPQSRTNDYGTTATFDVTAVGTGPFKYQWYKSGGPLSDGGNIVGSHSNVLTITSVSYPDGATYYVTVTNSLGATANSDTANLTVNDPIIVTQPTSVTNVAGTNVTFHVVADGTPSLFYQWLKNGNILFDFGNISGANSDTLTISNISSADEANYSVQVTGGYSTSATSSNASLTVLTPAKITVQPNPRTVVTGSRAAFAVGATGTGTLSYQWRLDGTNLPGATAAAYALASAQPSDAGSYSVIVSSSLGSVTSAPVALIVSASLNLYETNLVVIRVGEGSLTLTINGSPMSLDQFTTSGTYVNTIIIPDDGLAAMVAIGWDNINGVNNGSTTGSCLTRSLDGRFMVVVGYNTNLNYGSSLLNSFAAEVPRGIGLVDSYAQYTLPVSSTDSAFDQTFWRAAVTDGTNNFWGSGGKTGTYYFGLDASPAVVQNTFVNSRSMGLFNGDIYCAEASVPRGILKIDGMPTTTVTPTVLFDGSTGTFDMAVNPDGTLIYVADQRAISNSGGLQRWHSNGSTWDLDYTLTTGFGNLGPRYVTGDFSGPNPVLYVTSNDQTFDNNRLIKVEDTGAGSAGVTLAYAGVNQTFRGLHFGPVPNTVVPRPTLFFERQGDDLILHWSGAFILQSAPEVTGLYSDVLGATNPYTNSVTTTNQLFFLLRN